jgi:hypothetical protein
LDLHGSRKDVLAGAMFVFLGLAFAVTAGTYEVGSALRMGPGYFPLVLGGMLVVLGILIAVTGLVAREGGELGPVPWKAAALLIGALLFFGFTVRGLGLVPSVFVAAFMSAMAGRGTSLRSAGVIAASITALSYLIFVVILQLRLPIFGYWLQG